MLLDKFRDDISCEVLERFHRHGLGLKQLLKLQRRLPMVYPWDPTYDQLKYNVNRRFVFFPMAICLCQSSQDVVEVYRWARRHHLQVTIRTGSHCFESYSLSDGIIIDQSQRTKVQIQGKRAYLEPGCLLGPTALALSKHDLAFAGGTCVNTAVAGLTLGGGIGFLTRRYGLSSDNLLEAEVLLANGELVRANRRQHSDLYWALRGAGNQNYGIVTGFVFRLHRVPRVTIFDLVYTPEQLRPVVQAWQDWAPFTVDEMTSELDVYQNRVLVTGQMIGSPCQTARILKQAFGHIRPRPKIMIREVPFVDAVRHFGGRGRWMPFFENKSGFVRQPFPEAAIEIIQRYMQDGDEEDHVELNAFGGRVNRVAADATAFPHRDALFWCHLQKHFYDQDQAPKHLAWINNFYQELRPYLHGAYINCPDRDLPQALQEYYGDNLTRLRQIKTKYDPENQFRYHQSIPPF